MGSTVVKREPHVAQLEPGVYDATISLVEAEDQVETKYGLKDVLYITFDIEGVPVRKRYTHSWNENSNLYKLVAVIKPGEEKNDEYDVAELTHEKVQVLIEHNTDETGGVWDNITTVTKARPKPKPFKTFEEDARDPNM